MVKEMLEKSRSLQYTIALSGWFMLRIAFAAWANGFLIITKKANKVCSVAREPLGVIVGR